MNIPRFHDEYWDLLVSDIRSLLQKGTDVLLMCIGGHGRTGLAASIVCHKLAPKIVGNDPITWVREKYCKQVVETEEQIQYIHKVLDLYPIPHHVQPTKPYGNWTYIYGDNIKTVQPTQGGVIKTNQPKESDLNDKAWWEDYFHKYL